MTSDVTDGRTRRGQVIRLLLALQILIVVGAVAVWYHGRSAGAALSTDQIVQFNAPVHGPISLEAALPLAEATAHRWNPHANLFTASEQLDWSQTVTKTSGNDTPGGGWLSYVFVAPVHKMGANDNAASLSIMIDRNSGSVVAATTLSWHELPTDSGVTLGHYPISSATALQIAEQRAGRVFRHGCAADRHETWLGLTTDAKGQTVWLVTYQDTRNLNVNGLSLRINAETGKIINQQQQVPACG